MPGLEERLRYVEDMLAIYNVVSAYGPAVDGSNAEAMDEIFAEDGVYDIRDALYMDGLADIREMMTTEGHRLAVEGGCAHVSNVPHVRLSGDRAIATNYAMLLGRSDGLPQVMRASISRIYLSRGTRGWRVDRRILAPLDGRPESRQLAARLFEGPDQDPGARSDEHSLARGEAGPWQIKAT